MPWPPTRPRSRPTCWPTASPRATSPPRSPPASRSRQHLDSWSPVPRGTGLLVFRLTVTADPATHLRGSAVLRARGAVARGRIGRRAQRDQAEGVAGAGQGELAQAAGELGVLDQ